jgi:hypothetical protein
MLFPESRQPMRRKEIAVVVVAVCVVATLYGLKFFACIEPGILFVMPAKFEGAFVVVEDPHGAQLECIKGTFTVDVPPSRVLRVKSFEPFERMHREFLSIPNADGKRAVSMVNLLPGAGEGTLRSLGTGGGEDHDKVLQGRMKYFLGTEADAQACDFFAIPLD